MLLDLFTFFLFGGWYSFILLQAFPHLEAISRLTGTQMQSILEATTEEQMASAMIVFGEFQTHYKVIMWHLLYLILGWLVVWMIFQSLAWYSTKKVLGKVKFWYYVRDFIGVTFASLLVLLLGSYAIFRLLFIASLTEILTTSTVMPYAVGVLALVVLYLTTLAYTCLDDKFVGLFKKKLLNWKFAVSFLVFLILVVSLASGITFLVNYLGSVGVLPFLFLPLVLLIFPVITYGRVCLCSKHM